MVFFLPPAESMVRKIKLEQREILPNIAVCLAAGHFPEPWHVVIFLSECIISAIDLSVLYGSSP